jgi:hypothetical protein
MSKFCDIQGAVHYWETIQGKDIQKIIAIAKPIIEAQCEDITKVFCDTFGNDVEEKNRVLMARAIIASKIFINADEFFKKAGVRALKAMAHISFDMKIKKIVVNSLIRVATQTLERIAKEWVQKEKLGGVPYIHHKTCYTV